jgi:transcriptional regulator GlxA family with amidase domain
MRVLPHATIADAPALDVLLVPGGQGTRRESENAPLLAWIAKAAGPCRWVTSVCTGALLLAAAGPARGKTVTTHWGYVEALRARGDAGTVVENIRYVRDGNIVTAAGVSAGIDMALWLVGQLHTPALARATQRAMEYDPAPPYTAQV